MGKKTKLGKTRKDKYYQLAKETGYRSRAAFKLLQLNSKFGFLGNSKVCVDLCAAPGGWMQVAKREMPKPSVVLGVDLFPIKPIEDCISLTEDITTEKCRKQILQELPWKADVVLHDGAPNVSGNWIYDACQQNCLTLSALKLATQVLRKDGWFVTKVFRSKDYNALLWVFNQMFKNVHQTKPSASRKEAAETFVVCKGYFAPDHIDPRLLDIKYVFEELDLEGKKKGSMLRPDRQKRIKAEGYTEDDIKKRNNLAASDFMKAENALAALQGIGAIEIDEETIAKHAKTTAEILACCKDLKVLGRKDIKGLLAWQKAIKAELYPEVEQAVIGDQEEPCALPLTQEEIEDMEDEELQKQITFVEAEEQKELKRMKKKTLKAKAKLQEKMNLNMVIKGDEGPKDEGEIDLFELKDAIRDQRDLDQVLDVVPDFDVTGEVGESQKFPKYKAFNRDDKRLDDNGVYENDDEPELSADEESESDFDRKSLGLSDDEDAVGCSKIQKNQTKKRKRDEHPLVKSIDFRDKDTKRQQRVQLWYEKDNLQKLNLEEDEDYDLNNLEQNFKTKGVNILGQSEVGVTNGSTSSGPLGKKAKRRARHNEGLVDSSSESSDSEADAGDANSNDDDDQPQKEPKSKKVRLTMEELALGSMLIKGKKARRDLVDNAWNRYTFDDENLPPWFVLEEQEHMTKPVPVPKEMAEEYQRKVQELNVRPIKKVMEAKARKRRRAVKRLEKAKKQAEKVMDSADATAQEKAKQLKKLYKKAQDKKKKEVTYVVAKKHSTGRRAKRPAGVKGRYRIVDPREKKDKRAADAKNRRQKNKGKRKH